MNGLCDLARRQLTVDASILADVDLNVLALEGLEALCVQRTVYVPGVKSGATYAAAASAVKLRATPVSLFVTVTEAPVTAPPDWSVTVPRIRPVLICEKISAGVHSNLLLGATRPRSLRGRDPT